MSERKKRILMVSAVFPPEQVTSAYLNYDLAKELAKDYKVTVLRPKPTRPIGATFQQDWSDPDFETIMLDSYTHPHSDFIGRTKESVSFGKKCASYIREYHNEIDFIYNDGWQFFGLYLVAKAAYKHNIPYIVPIQDIYPEGPFVERNIPSPVKKIITGLLLPIDRYYQKKAVAVRTITAEMRDYLSITRKIPKDNYFIVNNWQNDEDFRILPEKKSNDDKIVFAYVGSINVHANVDLQIRAFAKANIENSEFRIYGGGNRKEQCQKLVQELGLTNVTFGFVSRDSIPRVQSEADVLVLALPAGNGKLSLPSKLTSYMLSERPVIASVDTNSTTARIINDNHSGYTVAPDNIELLADAFRLISENGASERKTMGENSRKYAIQELTRTINLKKVVDKIKETLG